MKKLANLIALAFFMFYAGWGQTCNSNIPESTPTSRFTDNGNGTVTDTKTGIMWKRCAEGQIWTGSTCSGTAAGYT